MRLKQWSTSMCALLATAAQAATASAAFKVELTYAAPALCFSRALSQQTNALVRVTCQGNQFVSIEPQHGKPFVGTHGGTYRFLFNTTHTGRSDSSNLGHLLEDRIGQGTITALRVLDLTETDERLELLVSF
jgi:hypothetical protein